MTWLEALIPAGCGFVISWGLGYLVIPWLGKVGAGQHIRSEGPKSHQKKAGTPIMGGVIFIVGTILALSIYHIVSRTMPSRSEVMVLGLYTGYGLVGFADDYKKVRKQRNLGLKAREKILLQILIAVAFMWPLVGEPWVIVPFTKSAVDLGCWYSVLSVILIVGMGNGVNLTDGLDGLAAGVVAIGLAGYSLVAWGSSQALGINMVPLATAGMGSVLGFLLHNRNPAKVFMGDVGSLALGGLLAGLAVTTKAELLIVFFGAVPIIEALSVILQVASFQLTGRRIFRMSPVHHHFELLGWKEKIVVTRCWVAAFVFLILGILSMVFV